MIIKMITKLINEKNEMLIIAAFFFNDNKSEY